MSAADTARRMLDWAAAASGPPPQGDLLGADRLLAPEEPLRHALARLGAVTAARLRIPAAIPGMEPRIGLDGLLLATALGARQIPDLTRAMLATLRPPVGVWDCLVRHGVAEPTLGFLPEEIADDVRTVSPLTALLERPARGQEGVALAWARYLWGERDLRLALVLALANPAASPAVRRWRADLLDRLRLDGDEGRRFVLDVYEAAMIHHEDELMRQGRAARAVLLDSLAAADSGRLEEALALADWWGALAAMERTHLDELRERRYLGYGYREGLRLHREAQALRGLR